VAGQKGDQVAVFRFTPDDEGDEDLVRRIVLYRLAHDKHWHQLDAIWEDQRTVEFPRIGGRDARRGFVFMAHEVMHRLLVQGIIAPGLDANNLLLPFFHITSLGHEVLQASAVVPYDPSGYLAALRQVTSRSVLLAYAKEAVRCFDSACFTAAVFFLGVACESLLVEIHASLSRTKRPENAPIKHKYDELVKLYESLAKQEKRKLPDTLDIQLGATYNMIRRQRNELGHPQSNPPAMDQRQAFCFFMVFPELVRDVEAFGQYCVQNGL